MFLVIQMLLVILLDKDWQRLLIGNDLNVTTSIGNDLNLMNGDNMQLSVGSLNVTRNGNIAGTFGNGLDLNRGGNMELIGGSLMFDEI